MDEHRAPDWTWIKKKKGIAQELEEGRGDLGGTQMLSEWAAMGLGKPKPT